MRCSASTSIRIDGSQDAAACNLIAAGDVGGCNADLRGDIVRYQDEWLPRVREEQEA